MSSQSAWRTIPHDLPANAGWASRPRYAPSDFITLLWRERWLMLGVFLVILALGVVFAMTLKKAYSAESSILIQLGQEYVYEPRAGRIHYRTFAQPRVKRIELAHIDFSCATGARFVDMGAERWGDVTTSMHPWDPEANLRLVQQSFGKSRVPIPAAAEHAVASFPDRFRCTEPSP